MLMMLMRVGISIVCLWVGRTPSVWDGRVQHWGTMREVLAEGKSEGRLHLSEVLKIPHAFAVGAMAGLHGEILIVDGVLTTSRVELPDRQKTISSSSGDAQACLLTVAYVSQWNDHQVERDIPFDQLEKFLIDEAVRIGIDTTSPFPFQIDGLLSDVSLHIVNRGCPEAAAKDGISVPFRRSWERVTGTIVGFFAPNQQGIMTHHGLQTHMHGLFESDNLVMGHIDSLSLRKGAVLRLPQSEKENPEPKRVP